MIAAILNGLIGFFNSLLGTFFGPLFNVFDSLLDVLNLTPTIEEFNTFLIDYVAPFLSFFWNFLTPKAMNVILLELTVTLFFFNISLVTHVGLKILKLIKKLPLA